MTPTKEYQLEVLFSEMKQCQFCRDQGIGAFVPGEGSLDADIMFVGEAPGKQESIVGRPFIGRSGKLLRNMIHEIGLDERDVYITSPVKYLPKTGTPTRASIDHARDHFLRQIEIIHPQIVVLMGNTSTYAVLNEHMSVLKNHGKKIKRHNKTYLITLHPAAVLRFPRKYLSLWKEDFDSILDN